MAPKPKKGLKGSINDVLGELLGDDMILPEKPVEPVPYNRDATDVPPKLTSSKARGRSFWEDEGFDTLGGLAADAEVSDISDPDPQALLQAIKDLDDMDADLLCLKKSPASDKRAVKSSGKEELPYNPKPAGRLTASEKGDTSPTRKPSPSPSNFGHQYRRLSFEDLEDPLARLLSDDEEGIAKKLPVTESKTTSNKNPSTGRDPGPSIALTPGDTPVRKKNELLFDDGDDIMATLGFGDSPTAERKQMGGQEGPQPARSKLDELLGRGTATKLLAHPGTGEQREFKLDKKYQRSQDKEDTWDDRVLTFGAYQPTLGSLEGRQSRRQSVRFLTESSPDPKEELGSKWSPPTASSPIHPRKGGADWLGLKDEDLDLLPASPTQEPGGGDSVMSTPSIPPPVSQHSASGLHSTPPLPSSGTELPAEVAMSTVKSTQAPKVGASQEKEEAEDWLSHVLSQKKSQGLAREEHTGAYKTLNPVGTASSSPSGSQPVARIQGVDQAAARRNLEGAAAQEALAIRPDAGGSPTSCSQGALSFSAGDLKKKTASEDPSYTELATCFLSSQKPTVLPVPIQSLVQNLLPGTGYQKPLLTAQAQLQSDTGPLQATLLQCQARLAELEAQVRKLEQAQHRMLLESLKQRHQADLELIESAHRSRIKVLETSYQQREERLQRENEELSAQYLSHCHEAEQAHAELTAQHQHPLATADQEKDQEMILLRELQRSLNGVIEQMEKFSSSLNELASRVEALHLTTSQERELGIQQRDEQLRVLQERLDQQQRDMEERSRLREDVGKMEARLSEQSRLLEQECWRVNAEQSKVESMQRALEEQRKLMVQQISMERKELERAKSALLEEQKSVMHKCGEERDRLAMEWAEFSTQQKLSKERVEREVERALQADAQREGTIISLANEQAELKVRASELRAKEVQLDTEREAVARLRQELQLEKEKVKATALSLQLQAQEMEHMSKAASKKYEEGELALHKAQQMQSEQQARLWVVQRQHEQLRQQEEHVHQEHLSLAQQRLQLDYMQQDLPCCLPELFPKAQGPAPSSLCAASAFLASAPASRQHKQLLAGPGPSHFQAMLIRLKLISEQDRAFLEDEQFYLESLKKAPYNWTSHSD